MKPLDIAEFLRDMWDNYTNVHARLIDIAQDIEQYGEFSEIERFAVEDLRNECEDMAAAFSALLEGEENAS